MSRPLPRFRALVLADDPGVRMRPLTGFVPKAMLPVAGQPLVRLALLSLAQAGCEAALIRVGPLGERLERLLGAELEGMELHYCGASAEQDTAAEAPSGASALPGPTNELLSPLVQLREFLSGAEVAALVPANRACRWPLRRLLKRHLKRSAVATMLVGRDRPSAPATAWVELQKKGWISQLRARTAVEGDADGELRSFLGACVIDAQALMDAKTLSRDARDEGATLLGLLRGWLAEGKPLLGFDTRRPCFELPTPLRYLQAARRWSRGIPPMSLVRRRFVAGGAHLEKRVRVRHSVIEGGATLERGCRLEHSLVLAGATVGAESRIERSIVAPGVLLSPHTRLRGRLVTPLKAGRAPGANDSVVGDLVYTPLGNA